MSKRSALWAVLLVAASLRLGWGLSRPATDRAIDALPDQREYLSIAQNMLAGRGIQFFDPRFGQSVHAYRMPGYPLLIALCGGSVRAVRVLQALLDTSTVLAVFLLSKRFLNDGADSFPASLFAAALIAINPFLIYFSGLILSETLFTAMLVWGMLLLIGPTDDDRGWPGVSWFCGALLLVLSIYARPSALALPVILAAAGAMALGRRGWMGLVLVFVLTWVALLPWAARNARPDVLGRWIWGTTNSGITAYDGWNPHASGASDQTFVREMPELRTMSEVQRSDYLGRLARQFVVAHPGRAIELVAIKLLRIWSPMPLSEQFGSAAYRWLALGYAVPFDLLVLAGLIRGKLGRPAKVFLLIPAIYLTAVHTASVGSLRYLLPAVGPMAVLAGSLVSGMCRQRGRI
jgi:hypothetical protein